jgi:hypothetical protein
MNRCILTIITAFIITISFAQSSSDFIQLKKKDKVIQSWFKDNDIYMQLKNGTWITALIYKIKDDSLYLRPYQVFYYTRGGGINTVDTVYYGTKTISVDYINAFPKQDEGSGLIRSGTLFKAAGGGYLLLNIINTLSKNDPVFGSDNLPNISIAAGVLAIGIALGLTHKSICIIGKKYHIEYIAVKPSS